ncbi:MAG TPA: hypothetical protein VK600_01085 [Candidatus Saccharimonadales bacterium]|nr:hypothetical protein [Candidatus Saccharimonadales bacterium]
MLNRYLTLGVLGTLLVMGILLVVRPLIFSFGSPRDDTHYPVVTAAMADAGPRIVELPLNDPHDLPGETTVGAQVRFTVVISPLPSGGYAAVAAWSPIHACRIALGPDRLVDCQGAAWTYQGIPLDAADPPLKRFPLTTTDGMVVVDFTRPYDAVGQ